MTQKTLWEEDLADLKTPKHDEIVLGMTKEKVLLELQNRKLLPEIQIVKNVVEDFAYKCPLKKSEHVYSEPDIQQCTKYFIVVNEKVEAHISPDGHLFTTEQVKNRGPEHVDCGIYQRSSNPERKLEYNETIRNIENIIKQKKQELESKQNANPPRLLTLEDYDCVISHEVVVSTMYKGSATVDLKAVVKLSEKTKAEFQNHPLYHLYGENQVFQFFFEVKTTIPSYGELMRQINHYRTHTTYDIEKRDKSGSRHVYERCWPWFVVSPDARFKDAIESQGIHFWKWSL